jgi:hypothetical protein
VCFKRYLWNLDIITVGKKIIAINDMRLKYESIKLQNSIEKRT